jgi:antitoxin FitA
MVSWKGLAREEQRRPFMLFGDSHHVMLRLRWSDISDIIPHMAQLIVRRIEEEIVARLRERAARRGVSAEEEHRQILRDAFLGRRSRDGSLKDHLARMPDVGDDSVFDRPRAKPRAVNL